jgi:hypothetical protein
MYSPLKQFVTSYLSVVFAALLFVGVFTFLAIPYGLGTHPGDGSAAQAASVAAAPMSNEQPTHASVI